MYERRWHVGERHAALSSCASRRRAPLSLRSCTDRAVEPVVLGVVAEGGQVVVELDVETLRHGVRRWRAAHRFRPCVVEDVVAARSRAMLGLPTGSSTGQGSWIESTICWARRRTAREGQSGGPHQATRTGRPQADLHRSMIRVPQPCQWRTSTSLRRAAARSAGSAAGGATGRARKELRAELRADRAAGRAMRQPRVCDMRHAAGRAAGSGRPSCTRVEQAGPAAVGLRGQLRSRRRADAAKSGGARSAGVAADETRARGGGTKAARFPDNRLQIVDLGGKKGEPELAVAERRRGDKSTTVGPGASCVALDIGPRRLELCGLIPLRLCRLAGRDARGVAGRDRERVRAPKRPNGEPLAIRVGLSQGPERGHGHGQDGYYVLSGVPAGEQTIVFSIVATRNWRRVVTSKSTRRPVWTAPARSRSSRSRALTASVRPEGGRGRGGFRVATWTSAVKAGYDSAT